jgi:hypothetical protein
MKMRHGGNIPTDRLPTMAILRCLGGVGIFGNEVFDLSPTIKKMYYEQSLYCRLRIELVAMAGFGWAECEGKGGLHGSYRSGVSTF